MRRVRRGRTPGAALAAVSVQQWRLKRRSENGGGRMRFTALPTRHATVQLFFETICKPTLQQKLCHRQQVFFLRMSDRWNPVILSFFFL